MYKTKLVNSLNELRDLCYTEAKTRGWWDNPREFGTLIALCHSELSEALEGDRKNLKDDHLPHRPSPEVELADLLIRVFDLCGHKGYDIGGAVLEKIDYNAVRADHNRENRETKHGKKY